MPRGPCRILRPDRPAPARPCGAAALPSSEGRSARPRALPERKAGLPAYTKHLQAENRRTGTARFRTGRPDKSASACSCHTGRLKAGNLFSPSCNRQRADTERRFCPSDPPGRFFRRCALLRRPAEERPADRPKGQFPAQNPQGGIRSGKAPSRYGKPPPGRNRPHGKQGRKSGVFWSPSHRTPFAHTLPDTAGSFPAVLPAPWRQRPGCRDSGTAAGGENASGSRIPAHPARRRGAPSHSAHTGRNTGSGRAGIFRSVWQKRSYPGRKGRGPYFCQQTMPALCGKRAPRQKIDPLRPAPGTVPSALRTACHWYSISARQAPWPESARRQTTPASSSIHFSRGFLSARNGPPPGWTTVTARRPNRRKAGTRYTASPKRRSWRNRPESVPEGQRLPWCHSAAAQGGSVRAALCR